MSDPSPTLVFAHGWATGNWFWQPLLKSFSEFQIAFCSRHYFESPASEGSPEFGFDTDQPWIGIGHSFGFRRLTEKDQTHCRGLISICGFFDFCRPEGTNRRIVNRMIRAFDSKPASVLREFFDNSGFADIQFDFDQETTNLERLREDLVQLTNEIEKPANLNIRAAFAGNLDRIVPPGQTHKQFDRVTVHPATGHSLGFHEHGWLTENLLPILAT